MNRLAMVLAIGTSFLAACGGGSKATSCSVDKECAIGLVCQTSTKSCVERPCTNIGDCTADQICVAIDTKADPTQLYCTWRQCTADGTIACPNATDQCVGGLCKAGTSTADDDRDVPATETTVEDVPAEVVTPPEKFDCKTCSTKADCGTAGNYFCSAIGSGKFCLKGCAADSECEKGYVCYPVSTEGKQCLPLSYDCKKCAFDEPCAAGQCCDLVSGSCEACSNECGKCTYDFDCGAGMRCYRETASSTGACVKECATAACTDAKFTCTDVKGVKLCVPGNADDCTPCPDAAKPFLVNDECVECRNSADCKDAKTCNVTTHVCEAGGCTSPSLPYLCQDGSCHQCCEDSHCTGTGDGTCNMSQFKCNGVVDPCNDTCAAPFPVCAVVSGQAQCVACEVDGDCASVGTNCVCSNYTCFDGTTGTTCGTGGSCEATCTTAADCYSATGATLDCHADGYCFDPAGSCDGVSACCSPGQSCIDLLGLLFGGLGGMGMGLPSTGMAACSCSTAGDCLGTATCTPSAFACALPLIGEMVCPGGTLPAGMPENICFDFNSILGGLGI